MILDRTVLVLGAGASVDYGYPTGPSLRRELIRDLGDQSGGGGLVKTLGYSGFSSELIQTFRDALLQSAVNSVDELLEHRLELVDVGKAAIAWNLVRRERMESLFTAEHNWYQHLLTQMNCPFD